MQMPLTGRASSPMSKRLPDAQSPLSGCLFGEQNL